VGTATRVLSEQGAVAYDGERLQVRDRAAPERLSCDCYQLVRGEYERLLTPVTSD
jgi:hypothetical protein